MAERGEYAGAGYSTDVKAALGAIGHGLRERGWSVREVGALFSDVGYDAGDETLRRWSNASGAGEPVISLEKKSGSTKKVDDEQRQVAAGWVLSQEKKVNRRRYSGFIKDEFDIDISPGTASKYLAEFDLTRQMMGSRPRDPGVSFDQYAKEGYDYIVDLHNTGFLSHEPGLIWSVDFTSTAIRQQRHFTYGAKGAKQQKYTAGVHEYTDNIMTMCAMDGSIIMPHGFSSNPALRPNSPIKVNLCKTFDIPPEYVMYCADSPKWVGETSSMVYSVVKDYDWRRCHVIHDDGNSWKPKGENIFYTYKADRVSAMPHNPHGEISPNDCNYHSVAKEAERADRPDDASDAEITFRTIHHLANVKTDTIKSFWVQNLMLDEEKLSYANYVDMLKGRKKMNSERRQLHSDCIDAFNDYMADDGAVDD